MVCIDNLAQKIGTNIRRYRKLMGISREKLAEIIDIDPGYLGQCERGERQLGLTKTIEIIKFFNVSANDIFEIKCENNNQDNTNYINKINESLNKCNSKQLMALSIILPQLILFLKD